MNLFENAEEKSCAMGLILVYFLPLISNIAELCKGSTPVSGTVCLGSNPSSAAIRADFEVIVRS